MRITVKSNELKQRASKIETLGAKLKEKSNLLQCERNILVRLASQVKEKSQEQEHLVTAVAKQRNQGLTALAKAEQITLQLDSKIKLVNNQLELLHRKEMQLADESSRIRKEAEALRETKESILCSLCSMSVNQAKRLSSHSLQLI